ncbi:MAG TPA: FAD-binding protein [Gemmatimonadaceae bacterium]|nr:FAD-binding protein [Gemmatimonadaceae bacterium]
MTSLAAHHPATVAELGQIVAAAYASARPLRIVGSGTWLDAGRAVPPAERLTVAALSGVVDYVPGDLTITVRAGTSLAHVADVVARERQLLRLDPYGSANGTVGATVATASCGPLAHARGTPRDIVLGLQAVTGTGETIRAGGRVVKNVAGFDLTRLFTGSWGTLGVIAELSLRLHAMPEVDATWALRVPTAPDALRDALRALRAAPLAALALELVNAPLAHRLGLEAHPCVLVRCAGNADAVRAQRRTLAHMGALVDAPASVWSALRGVEPTAAWVLRLSARPSELARIWDAAHRALPAAGTAWCHAGVDLGVVRAIVPHAEADAAAALAAARNDAARDDPDAAVTAMIDVARRERAACIGERLPRRCWEHLGGGAMSHPLGARVRAAFDPRGILNPGILGTVSHHTAAFAEQHVGSRAGTQGGGFAPAAAEPTG